MSTTTRAYNFNAGPSALPLSALEKAQAELLNFCCTGMSLLEMSHRSKEYEAVHNHTIALLRELLAIPEDYDVLFLCGIGEVFPYIRSHNVLNNLQSTAKDKPTVLFFPGEYRHSLAQGASLELFGLLHDDKYYRAFNIFETQA